MALAKRIIPCLDVDAGRVVKGVQFVDIFTYHPVRSMVMKRSKSMAL